MICLQTVEYIHSFTKYSQSAYAPDTILGTKARAVDTKKTLKLKAAFERMGIFSGIYVT